MKRLLFIIILLSLGGGGWWYFKNKKAETPEYNTETLSKGDITQVVTATGSLKPVINVTVGCQISGTIEKLFADFNSVVKEGDVLAQLDPSTYEAIVQQAEGDVANAKATLELAEITAQRKEELFKQKAASQADVDTANATLHQALAGVTIREGALKKARVDLVRCTINSPINGMVISRSVDVGQTVAASLSAPNLFTIANDMTNMQIDASVSEADIGMLAEGQNVEFTVDAFPYTPFMGVVSQIRNSPVTVQNVVTYDVLVDVKNPELKLKPGMTANVAITVAQRKDTLRVSNAALRFRPPETTSAAEKPVPGMRAPGNRAKGSKPERRVHVLKEAGGQPVPVKLKLGISDNIYTEVLGGVDEGETVVTGLKNPGLNNSGAPKPAANPLGGPQMRPR
jgi:HlyD family secretion protein